MSILLITVFALINCYAQDEEVLPGDTVNIVQEEALAKAPDNEKDTVRLFRSGVYVKIDYGKLLSLPSKFESKMEGEFGFVVFRRLILTGAYGQSTLNPNNAFKNVEYYTIEGSYLRFGMEYAFSVNPNNFFSLGGKYGMSNYSDEGKFLVGSDFWDEYQEEFGSDDLHANWIELVLNTETTLAKNLFLGAQFSVRIMLDFDTREEIPVYAIPGYGRHFDNSIPVANLYIKYRFPFN